MNLIFSTSSIQKLCENDKKLSKKYNQNTDYIKKRIQELKAFESLYFIRINPMYWLHILSWNRKNTMSMYVKMSDKTLWFRIIIKSINWEDVYNDFENIELFKSITEIEILEISNHYK